MAEAEEEVDAEAAEEAVVEGGGRGEGWEKEEEVAVVEQKGTKGGEGAGGAEGVEGVEGSCLVCDSVEPSLAPALDPTMRTYFR